jgi:hypothetical protein
VLQCLQVGDVDVVEVDTSSASSGAGIVRLFVALVFGRLELGHVRLDQAEVRDRDRILATPLLVKLTRHEHVVDVPPAE